MSVPVSMHSEGKRRRRWWYRRGMDRLENSSDYKPVTSGPMLEF